MFSWKTEASFRLDVEWVWVDPFSVARDFVVNSVEEQLPYETNCLRLLKYDRNQFKGISLIPKWCSLASKRSWLTVSNALDKSRHIASVNWFSSNALYMCEENDVTANPVKLFFLYPNCVSDRILCSIRYFSSLL